ncbi:MAG: hypothetical protein JW846_01890 [Dehalococcoidia bacterium]|nr:hypothetical protein [Dehalococcoidia bacterium]
MLKTALVRAMSIVRTEGPLALFRHAVGFSAVLSRGFYRKLDVYLYRHALVERDGAAYLPRLDSHELRVVESNEQAEQLVSEGFEDFRQLFLFSRRNLAYGAVAFCVYVDKRLAHIGWVAVDEKAKAYVDAVPFRVAFDQGEACTGGSHTFPRYRGKGLMVYGYYVRLEYLRVKGFTASRNSVEVHNVASHRAHAKFSPEITGVGWYRRVLGWSRWTESPFPGGPVVGIPPPWDR